MAIPTGSQAYNAYIEGMRGEQYPMLKNELYLDYAGSSLSNKRTLDAVHGALLTNMYGNSHSSSSSGLRSARLIENVRTKLLRFFNADPESYDLVITANTTAAIALVSQCLRDVPGGFSYGYHVDSHTSIIGLRELATEARCHGSHSDVEIWHKRSSSSQVKVFAYPAQSNMSGKRHPLDWCRLYNEEGIYVLLDAAAYASTTRLDIDAIASDFTVVSLYKIFGLPDLGALIVKKSSGHLLQHRKYFGGGTVDLVTCTEDICHVRKKSLHEQLEDGTLPIHNILALEAALQSFDELFGGLEKISRHTLGLAQQLYDDLKSMKHSNGHAVCEIYSERPDAVHSETQGPIVAFNITDHDGTFLSTTEFDKVAAVKNIHLRVGALCNPGGTSKALGLTSADMRDNYSAGYRCGRDNPNMNGKPTGVIRISFGASSTMKDAADFVAFVREYFQTLSSTTALPQHRDGQQLCVEHLTIYPIKSCAGWSIPYDKPWRVTQEGLAWDREWCIVHAGTGKVLTQKQYPKMALICPAVDVINNRLAIRFGGGVKLEVLLHQDQSVTSALRQCSTNVCDDVVEVIRYTSPALTDSLSTFLGVPCYLARFPALEDGEQSRRHSKEHLRSQDGRPLPLSMSNESPILVISRASLDALNESLKARGKRAVHHSVFRANIVLAELPSSQPGTCRAWAEDAWQQLDVTSSTGGPGLQMKSLRGCRRCQMVCIDQQTGSKRAEVFLTLAQQRRIDGRVLFGIHCASTTDTVCRVQIGDAVVAS